MERKCSCGNFFDVRECNGICPECKKDIFNQSTQDNNVSKKTNNLNMSKQQTALQLFHEAILSGKITDTLANIDYYLELERQQIIDAIKDCRKYPYIKKGEVLFETSAEQYYNDKYGK